MCVHSLSLSEVYMFVFQDTHHEVSAVLSLVLNLYSPFLSITIENNVNTLNIKHSAKLKRILNHSKIYDIS